MPVSSSDKIMLSVSEQKQVQTASDKWTSANKAYETAKANKDTNAMAAAQVSMDTAHAEAEAVRASHSYSGGEEGNSFISIAKNIISSVTDKTSGSSSTGPANNVVSSVSPISGPSGNVNLSPVSTPNSVVLPTDVYDGNFEGATSVGEPAGGSADVPKGVKTIFLLFGGLIAISMMVSFFKGGKK